MIRFTCECGKQLQAREESAGKVVACPACKRQMRVPEPPASTFQVEEPVAPAPTERAVRRDRPAIREEPEFEEEDRPRRRREPQGTSGKATASLVLGILSLVCGCTCLTGLPSLLLGFLALRDIGRAGGLLGGKVMAIIGMVLGGLGTLCYPPGYVISYLRVQDARERVVSTNNLKQMALAMINYNDTYNRLPPAGLGDPRTDREGQRPLLSWRVALLPYLEQQNLYSQFKLDEPWDGPNNIRLLDKMPKVYELPGAKAAPGNTYYQVFVGPGTVFEKGQILRFPASILDGTSNTILIVEAAQAVPWTKPEDLPFEPQKPLPALGGHFRSGFNVALADGSTRLLDQKISEKTLKAAITRNGGEVLGPDW